MTDFDAAVVGFASLDEAVLGRPWSFRDKPMDVRYALYRTLEDAQEVLVDLAAAGPQRPRIAPGRRAWAGRRSVDIRMSTAIR